MHLKATILTLILTAAACISSSAATDTLSTVTDDRKDSKLARFLSEKVSVSGYAQAGYQYDTYDMAHDGAFNKFSLNRAMIIADVKPIRHLDLYFMADVSKFKPTRSMRSTSGSDSTRPPSQSRAICLPPSWK